MADQKPDTHITTGTPAIPSHKVISFEDGDDRAYRAYVQSHRPDTDTGQGTTP